MFAVFDGKLPRLDVQCRIALLALHPSHVMPNGAVHCPCDWLVQLLFKELQGIVMR